MSEKLLKTREYEAVKSSEIPAEQRPVFHMSPAVGWANDPNGFSVYMGEYHLFYQNNPYGTRWGNIHWGHYKSRDLISWEYVPSALAPDMPYDKDGCFSGSAIEWQGKHYLMYTSNREDKLPDGTLQIRQTQSMAVGNGRDYEKFPENPVITADTLPEGSSLSDFRDPKLWREDDGFYAVIGSRSPDGSGQIALYSSRDLRSWRFVSILDRCNNEYGKMWECPDFFPLDGKQVLIVSPQEMLAEGLEHHNGNGSLCLIGSYDKGSHTFTREAVQAIDYGMDFYAGQTTETPDGRRVLVAWMNNWENYLTPNDFKWSGPMVVPRELTLRDGRLCQNPVRELEKYRTDELKLRVEASEEFKELPGVGGRVFDMTVELDTEECKSLKLRVAADGRFYTSLVYDGTKQTFTTDRTYSGSTRDLLAVRTMPLTGHEGRVKLRILMDKYTVEVFANDGERVMSSLIYTPLEAEKILFCSDGAFEVMFSQIKKP